MYPQPAVTKNVPMILKMIPFPPLRKMYSAIILPYKPSSLNKTSQIKLYPKEEKMTNLTSLSF